MAEAFVTDGDLGSGEPGSLSWHKCQLRQLDNDGQIAYIREAFPNMLIDDMIEIVAFLIREKLNGDGN